MMRRFVSKFPRWTIGFRKFDDFLVEPKSGSYSKLGTILKEKSHIDGNPKESDFEIKSDPLVLSVEPDSNGIIVKNLYVSIDPNQLNRMKCFSSSQKASSYAVALAPGHVIDAYGVGKVVASENPEFEKGDLVVGLITWGEYSVLKGKYMLRKVDPLGFPLSYHVGILGFSGLSLCWIF